MVLSRRSFALLLTSLAAGAGGTLLFTSACKIEPTAGSDRQQVLRDLVANVIVPTYEDLATSCAALRTAVAKLSATPTAEALAEAQQAYRTARSQQKTSEAYALGPGAPDDILVTGGAIDAWPADGNAIEALISGSGPLATADVAKQGANKRGFPGLEWLLFDSAMSDAVLTRLQQSPRRAALAAAIADDLALNARKLADAFSGPSGYGVQLAEAGIDTSRFATQAEGIDEIATGLLYVAELMVMKKLAGPLGVTGPSTPEEGARSDSSLADLRDNLLGVQAIYTGVRGARAGQGLAVPVRAANARFASSFEQALADAQAKLAAVPPPLRGALLTSRPAVEALYQAVRALKTSIQTELTMALGANIGFGFSDTD